MMDTNDKLSSILQNELNEHFGSSDTGNNGIVGALADEQTVVPQSGMAGNIGNVELEDYDIDVPIVFTNNANAEGMRVGNQDSRNDCNTATGVPNASSAYHINLEDANPDVPIDHAIRTVQNENLEALCTSMSSLATGSRPPPPSISSRPQTAWSAFHYSCAGNPD